MYQMAGCLSWRPRRRHIAAMSGGDTGDQDKNIIVFNGDTIFFKRKHSITKGHVLMINFGDDDVTY